MGATIIELNDTEKETIRTWTGNGETEQRMSVRAGIILLGCEGDYLRSVSLIRRKPVSVVIFAPWKSMLMDLSKSGLIVPVCLSPNARMQLSLPLTKVRHNIR
jgi:hypothetical protein